MPESTSEDHSTIPLPDESDSPADRERAWYEFKGAMTQAFADHPERIILRQGGTQELPLDNSDPTIDSLHLTIQPPGRPPSYLFTGDFLDINYRNGDRVVYEYTSDSEVIKWVIEREKEGAIPKIPPLPSEDLSIEEKLRALHEITLQVQERKRNIGESIANLKLAKKWEPMDNLHLL